jgi:hypothetical protein
LLALTFITGDARFAVLKDSLTSFLAGIFFLGSCAPHRPLTYHAGGTTSARWTIRSARRTAAAA